ncbi:copper-translocating P-type ATPase [Apiospora rasikravindrae]|uniref:Copper-translocating P-type ATPase n=1 Tax=Apiospora rasikravindrae TaxID=990691 RepID=A0ABR1UDE9_9PEZI
MPTDGCCSGETGACSPAPSSNTTKKTDCCKPAPVPVVEDCGDGCCGAPKAVAVAKCAEADASSTKDLAECPDPCCKGEEVKVIATDGTSDCCDGKPSPCCNDDCIDRIALRECEKSTGDSTGHCSKSAAGHTACSEPKSSSEAPCTYHVRQARSKYAERLGAIGCICRALVALGQKSCCASPKDASLKSRNSTKRPAIYQAPGNPCVRKSSRKRPASCSGDACCSGKAAGSPREPELQTSARDLRNDLDIEKGLPGTQHAVISVSGMTCTGCETKLVRALESFQGITNLKASLVMSRAEFDYDSRIISATELTQQLGRKTGFLCEEISTRGTSIDVLLTGDVKAFTEQALPLGVTAMKATDKYTIRITFDPKVVGARDLIEKSFNAPLELAPIRRGSDLGAENKHVRHEGYMTGVSAILTIPVLVLAWAPLDDRPITYGAVSLALATIVQFAIAGPFYPAALKSLVFSRLIEMDLLIVLSTSAAYVFSVVSFGYLAAGRPLATGQFFETSTLLVTLIMVGRFVSAFARHEALKSISIRSLQETRATLVSVDGEMPERDVDSRLLQYGDAFKLKPDSRAPTDGIVLSGSSEVDESMLTGESRPVEKHAGSMIAAGSMNSHGNLIVRLNRLPDENTISTIAGMVDDAKLTKPKLQSMANYMASRFVPAVIGLTILVFVVWIGVGIREQKRTPAESAIQAVTYAIAVLVVSCPCAIGLAVPMVIVIASGMAARRGIIFKSAAGIETVHKVTHIVFDKTGTLTEGILSVVAEEYVRDDDPASTAAAILGLVGDIKHPVSAAMASHLRNRGIEPAVVRDIKSLTGRGVEGFVGEKRIQAGNSRWLGLETEDCVRETSARGFTTLCVTIDSRLVAVFGLSDSIRTDAVSIINKLKKRGIALSILSGDELQAVTGVAETIGIPASMVKARCSPADKAKYIKDLISASPATNSGSSKAPTNNVIFVGDGTNDAPALAQATTGVHLPPSTSSAAADVASSAADVVLLRSSLEGLVDMLDISRAAVRRIWFNFGWSFVYNVFAILLAAGAFVAARRDGGVRIPPAYAGLGELVSVLPVIFVAVSLRWSRVWGQ